MDDTEATAPIGTGADPEDAAPAPQAGEAEPAPGGPPLPDPESIEGPLDADLARALLARGDELLDDGQLAEAGRHYRRVVGSDDDPAVTAAALLGLGQTLSRLGRTDLAISTWMSIMELPRSEATYLAWREVAAAHVREGDLRRATEAYRNAERLAPPDERPEIAARLGWLAKETGDPKEAQRWFRAARGQPAMPMTWLLMGFTIVVSVAGYASIGTEWDLYAWLTLDKAAVATGEVWRLWTTALLHAPLTSPIGFLHLAFNMYALYVVGPVVERFWGGRLLLAFYLLFAAAGSIASLVFASNQFSVGASGAVFGLIGLVFVAGRVHHWAFDLRTRAFAASLGMMVVFNLAIGFSNPIVDNAAHIGGLVAGAVIGLAIPPRNTVASGSPIGQAAGRIPTPTWFRVLAIVGLLAALVAGLFVGRALWLP
jgi:rhomboid protease GluP